MGNHTHHFKVTDNGTSITIEPPKDAIKIGDAVSWILTSDSEPGSSVDIIFTGASPFNASQYASNLGGGFGLIATSLGNFDYTVTSADGKRSTDPVIVVDPA